MIKSRNIQKTKRYIGISAAVIIIAAAAITLFCVFFDQAVIVRKATIYRVNTDEKVVALTFDDGPSPVWTPQILDEVRSAKLMQARASLTWSCRGLPSGPTRPQSLRR